MVVQTRPETAIAYLRVSSNEQANMGISLDAQEARVRAYAAMRGLDLIAIYREEAVSGKVPLKDRPEGSKLVGALGRRKVAHVVTVKLDRLFRNAADALQQSSQWDKAGVALHVIDMGGSAIDTRSAVGRMFFTMIAAFAEMERALASERTVAALAHLRKTGRVYSHFTPFGFDRDGDNLVPNVDEMETVEWIKERQAIGTSLRQIAAMLEERHIPTKRGGTWHLVTVQNVLRIHSAHGKS
jgi:DNA invertase Pin-like site-specific DNA recombinase